MTQDFRQQGPREIGSADGTPMTQARSRQIVVPVLLVSAVIFFCAGVWLLIAEQSVLPPEIAGVLGPIFMLVAFIDVITARFLKRYQPRNPG